MQARLRLSYADSGEFIWDSDVSDMPFSMALSLPCDSPQWISIEFWVYPETEYIIIPGKSFVLLVYSSPEAFSLLDPSTFSSWKYNFMMADSMYLDCGDQLIIPCEGRGRFGQEESIICSSMTNNPKPATDAGIELTSYFWPLINPLFQNFAERLNIHTELDFIPNKHILVVVLDRSEKGTLQKYYDKNITTTCVPKFTGTLVTQKYDRIENYETSATKEGVTANCDFEKLSYLLTATSEITILEETTVTNMVEMKRFWFTDAWMDCFRYVAAESVDKVVEQGIEYIGDTCAPTETTFTRNILNQTKVSELFGECDTACSATIMEDLDFDGSTCDLYVPTDGTFIRAVGSFYNACMMRVFRTDVPDKPYAAPKTATVLAESAIYSSAAA
eukprot:TRINITY_DN3739_c0_g1_i1.p1 TRINITY_DN3739_c0_g1~~TRINITY_DN3739_c0_g1_i1.p1  ORF type:complete len:389 (-),score=72.73 TRINITY_DN3739_c0_g1_i1:304-1470(-)